MKLAVSLRLERRDEKKRERGHRRAARHHEVRLKDFKPGTVGYRSTRRNMDHHNRQADEAAARVEALTKLIKSPKERR